MSASAHLRDSFGSALAKTQLVFHTVRHLKPIQIYSRLAVGLPRTAVDARPAPPLRPQSGAWVPQAPGPVALLDRWRVTFLNEMGDISRPQQWNDPAKSKLWLYNLHYFDDLAGPVSADRAAMQRILVERWIAENPPPMGNGWEPYPVSLRVVNWIKWHLGGQQLKAPWLDSLATQVRWLETHLEWHLLGNHILANAKALVVAGMCFAGPEAERWLAKGLDIYRHELDEQILSDGGHFELSPMYHAIILNDLLDLLNMSRAFGFERGAFFASLPALIMRMRQWLAVMTHPDGGISFFNDASFGIAPATADLERFATRLGLAPVSLLDDGLYQLNASGYIRVNRGPFCAFLDLAAVGPDYIPGHAHADTLSFELSVGAERVIVNGGTSTYAPSQDRAAQRATAAHSTVSVNGENSSEVWGSFRVARRARVTDVETSEQPEHSVVSGSHDGYHRLNGRPTHRRTWCVEDRTVSVTDRIIGHGPHNAVARFHLGRDVTPSIEPNRLAGRLSMPSGQSLIWSTSRPARLEDACWHPEFGRSVPTSVLAIDFDCGSLDTHFTLA